jgi:hypothetical protein
VREMLLPVYGASLVGDDGSGGATVWRNTGTSSPGRSRCSIGTHAHIHATAAASTTSACANHSATERRRQFE